MHHGCNELKRNAPTQTLDGKTHTINVESYKTVLEAALDEGIDMPHDCKLGTCLVRATHTHTRTARQTTMECLAQRL